MLEHLLGFVAGAVALSIAAALVVLVVHAAHYPFGLYLLVRERMAEGRRTPRRRTGAPLGAARSSPNPNTPTAERGRGGTDGVRSVAGAPTDGGDRMCDEDARSTAPPGRGGPDRRPDDADATAAPPPAPPTPTRRIGVVNFDASKDDPMGNSFRRMAASARADWERRQAEAAEPEGPAGDPGP